MAKGVGSAVAAIAACMVLAAACAGDEETQPPADQNDNTPGPGGWDGDTGSGSGGGPTSGPTGGSGNTELPCPYDGPPVVEASDFPACPSDTCAGGAHCVPSSLVPAEQAALLGDCDATSKCVPDPFIETMGNTIPATCSSFNGQEGRCLSSCIPQVAAQADMLPQDVCNAFEVCVPCFDPFTQASTGACELMCDPGAVEPAPEPLPSCCDGAATCVPTGAIPEGDQDKLDEDDCPEADEDEGIEGMLCVPNELLDPTWAPSVQCETSWLIQTFLGSDYAEGGCMPECLGAVQQFGISQGDCPNGSVCAPCRDPDTEGPSGACPWWTP